MLQVFSRSLEPTTYGLWRPLLRQLDDLLETQAAAQAKAPESWAQGGGEFAPVYDLQEVDDHYVLSFDIPGVQRDDLNIELTGNRLVVSGERKCDGRAIRGRHGKFQQVFTLPDGITAEGLVAEHKDGVLRLTIGKPSTVRATKIKIADSTGKSGFLKNLIGDKKAKDAAEVRVSGEKAEEGVLSN